MTLALKNSGHVLKKPVKAFERIRIVKRTVPGGLDGLYEARKTCPNGLKVELLLVEHRRVRPEQQRRMVGAEGGEGGQVVVREQDLPFCRCEEAINTLQRGVRPFIDPGK